ncbi:MAG: conjugal transfer protein TraB, partial [Burkholderiaceae bacterium]|nr:conjugal transfer protein TraB [Burkholderiaceae bacterium]
MNALRNPSHILHGLLARLSPRQRQYAMLAAILVGGVGLLWMVFSFTDSRPKNDGTRTSTGLPSAVTNIGVMPPGGQVNPVDQWVGTAGRKLAQYENEREEQGRLNKDRQAFESKTMQRFADLEQKLTSAQQAALTPPTPASLSPAPPTMPATPTAMPPAASLPPLPPPAKASPAAALPGGVPGNPLPVSLDAVPATPGITRITLAERSKPTSSATSPTGTASDAASSKETRTVSTFLPVSFTRGTLLGGLDAPTGGQSQSNPHPVLIRLSDNSILPNRFRGEYRDCFVVAAGYGDISSERAYLRTESLSC